MANESITDDIVRDFFKTNELYKNNQIIIEKQSSKTKKIDKLLKNASKSGGGKGYPDFIIPKTSSINSGLKSIELKTARSIFNAYMPSIAIVFNPLIIGVLYNIVN
jgi:hypothetical protein